MGPLGTRWRAMVAVVTGGGCSFTPALPHGGGSILTARSAGGMQGMAFSASISSPHSHLLLILGALVSVLGALVPALSAAL